MKRRVITLPSAISLKPTVVAQITPLWELAQDAMLALEMLVVTIMHSLDIGPELV
jgi:hypothetical protein